ncbi:DEAD/DEAH box helicase [candidate division WOR-3 bacterium]|nr:DEAD/DEAH box helicase [candidate division WOR-3 bacterium]
MALKPPQFIQELDKKPNRYYGTIEYTAWGNQWIITAEDHVAELYRRIFKSTRNFHSNNVYLPNNKRIVSDINWIMMKYPLKINNPKIWAKALEESIEYVMYREKIAKMPQKSPTPKRFIGDLYEFQKKGLAFLKNNKRTLLADEMGLGKTVQGLALLSKTQAHPSLIITPAHLQLQWSKEIERFLGEDIDYHQITGIKPYDLPECDIYLIHYLLIRYWAEELKELGLETILLDECQELRRTESLKYEMTNKVIQSSEPTYVIGLSGTPIYNYGVEIFNVLNVIEKDCLGTKNYFSQEWLGGNSRSNQVGKVVQYPELLGSYLYGNGLMLRRRKEDVFAELPEKNVMTQFVDYDKDLYIKNIGKSNDIVAQIDIAEDKFRGQLMLDAVGNARRSTGIAKSHHVAEFVKILLDAGEPVLLFAYHHDVMQLYHHYLGEYLPSFITGKLNQKQKNDSISRFMNGETNLMCVNMRTTAGLNLQRARCVVFGELDWTPSVHVQAEDRVHRIGQDQTVMCYYLISETPSDKAMTKCLGLKNEQFRGIMKDKEKSVFEVMKGQKNASNFMWDLIDDIKKGK